MSERLKLFLRPAQIANAKLIAAADEMYPGVELWEAPIEIGESARFVRILGTTETSGE